MDELNCRKAIKEPRARHRDQKGKPFYYSLLISFDAAKLKIKFQTHNP